MSNACNHKSYIGGGDDHDDRDDHDDDGDDGDDDDHDYDGAGVTNAMQFQMIVMIVIVTSNAFSLRVFLSQNSV